MAKVQRKSRTEVVNKVDLIQPINTVELIGSKNDPCFGKHHDPQHSICRRCGDNEVCAIVQGQMLHVKRAEQESKGKFKDMEEQAIQALTPTQKARKVIRTYVKEGLDEKEIVKRTAKGVNLTETQVGKILDTMISKGKLIKTKNKITLP